MDYEIKWHILRQNVHHNVKYLNDIYTLEILKIYYNKKTIDKVYRYHREKQEKYNSMKEITSKY